MIYAVIAYNGKERLCCVDKVGRRAFLADEFFKRDLDKLRIDSNRIGEIPKTMDEFIRGYNALWADDMALFFGSNPELGISLDPEKDWAPLIRLEEIWSPQQEARGRELLAVSR
jgi:hypothetical protein